MLFNPEMLITILQALQLVALAPCLFVILFFLLGSRLNPSIVVPLLYFVVLATTFLPPLLHLWPTLERDTEAHRQAMGGLIFVQSLLPSFSFLLIMQFLLRRVPFWYYWLILAVPLVGGSSMAYASMLAHEFCLSNDVCLPAESFQTLYSSIANAFIFMLVIVEFSRNRERFQQRHSEEWRNQYWLMITLIFFNLVLLGMDLLRISERISQTDASVITTLVRMMFVYLALTLLFRVFDREKGDVRSAEKNDGPTERDLKLRDAFMQLMEKDRYYRDVDCSRETVARKLGVNENYLSRMVNQLIGERFSDIVNRYRVEEAKQRLLAEAKTSVTTIAYEAGFNSIASFNRVFKEMVGRSPTQYRQEGVSDQEKINDQD